MGKTARFHLQTCTNTHTCCYLISPRQIIKDTHTQAHTHIHTHTQRHADASNGLVVARQLVSSDILRPHASEPSEVRVTSATSRDNVPSPTPFCHWPSRTSLYLNFSLWPFNLSIDSVYLWVYNLLHKRQSNFVTCFFVVRFCLTNKHVYN